MTENQDLTTTNTDATAFNPYTIKSPLADKKNSLFESGTGDFESPPKQKDQANHASSISSPATTTTNEESFDLPAQRKRPEGLVHTFKDDIQDLIKEQKLSMTKIRAIESDHGGRDVPAIERTSSGNGFGAMFAGIGILFCIAIGAAYYYNTTLTTSKPIPGTLAYGLFFTEGYEPIDITNKVPRAVRESFAVIRKRSVFSLGSVIELVPMVRIRDTASGEFIPQRISAKELVRALGAQVPALFTETLGPLYMAGVHVGDENIPFLVLTTTAYDYAFSGMIAWEKAIEEDLAPFMSPDATYTPPATTQSGNIFIDTVVRNYDIRVLRDETGTIRLLYGFSDRSTIIITTRVETFLTIAERLQVEKQ